VARDIVTENPKPSVFIVHNHWIHYKHLLFNNLFKERLDFKVCFTAYHSTDRLAPLGSEALAYPFVLLDETSSYERAPKLRCVVRLWAILQRERPKVLIISGWYGAVPWAAWFWGLTHASKMILWSESNDFDRPRTRWKEWMKSVFVRRFESAHVYGQSSMKYLLRLGMSESRITLKRAVLDVMHFRLPGAAVRKEGPVQLLYVGRFSPEKNLARLIEAFAATAPTTDVEIKLVGYGPLEGELRRLAEGLGVKERVVFGGRVEQDRLPDEYWRADAFILPSTSEPWGLVANEAMCCGLPVALSTRCGCTEDLVTEETGWSFDPLEPMEIERVIRVIATTDRKKLAEMGLAARRLSEMYSAENCTLLVARSIKSLGHAKVG
jgi:glycosyltransferase involved in cell wall biosynthesis